MKPDLEKGIHELSLRMQHFRMSQEADPATEDLTEREKAILVLLNERGKMTVSQIAESNHNVSYSTISTTITGLWRDKKMVSKTISPESQRVTIVELTEKGEKAVETYNQHRAERFSELSKALNVSDEERQILIRVLTRAIDFFDKRLKPKEVTD